MGTYNRFVLKELLVGTGFWFLVSTTVVMTGFLIILYRNLPSMGLGFVLLQGPPLLGYVAPHTLAISAALAGTLVLARLSAARELDALRTSGVPLPNLFTPVAATALLVSLTAAAFHLELTPAAYRHKEALEHDSILSLLKRPPPGEQTMKLGRTYLLRYHGVRDERLIQPFIIQRDKQTGTAEQYYIAASARVEFPEGQPPRLVLHDCKLGTMRSAAAGKEERIEESQFDELAKSLEELIEPVEQKEEISAMTMPQLWHYATKVAVSGKRHHDALARYHKRIADSLSPFPLLVLAAGIGMAVRRASLLAGLFWTIPSVGLLYVLRTVLSNPYVAVGAIVLAALGGVWRTRR